MNIFVTILGIISKAILVAFIWCSICISTLLVETAALSYLNSVSPLSTTENTIVYIGMISCASTIAFVLTDKLFDKSNIK
jgi:hypothetical protein